MIKRIANRDCSDLVERRQEFKGSNIYSEWRTTRDSEDSWYVVYSYGRHWPMYIYSDNKWFGNSGRYSISTSKHTSQAMPSGVNIIWLNRREMEALAEVGFEGLKERRGRTITRGEGNEHIIR